MSGSFHESFQRPEPRSNGSNRGFGLLIAAVFAIVAVRPLLTGGGARWWALVVAAALFLVGLAYPALLNGPKRAWLALGAVLARIVNPVVLGILFIAVITPTALVGRLMGRDPLRLRFERGAATYWMERSALGTGPVDMRKQF